MSESTRRKRPPLAQRRLAHERKVKPQTHEKTLERLRVKSAVEKNRLRGQHHWKLKEAVLGRFATRDHAHRYEDETMPYNPFGDMDDPPLPPHVQAYYKRRRHSPAVRRLRSTNKKEMQKVRKKHSKELKKANKTHRNEMAQMDAQLKAMEAT